MNTKLANALSTVGHPLLTILVFVVVALFNYESVREASIISALVLGLVTIPLSIKMYVGSKRGTYTNFDVSNKGERQSWYFIALFLVLILTAALFFTNQSQAVKWTTFFFLLLLSVSKFVNYFVKSSLHVSLNILVAFLIMPLHLIFGIVFLIFVLFVAWSRVALNRHTLKEVLYGGFIGLGIGFSSFATASGYAQQIFRSTKYVYSIPKNLYDGINIGNTSDIDTAKIIALTESILKQEFPNFHSLLIAKNSKLVYENYFSGTDEISGKKLGYIDHAIDDLHDCRSISKSITSLCIGIAIDQGLIKSLDEPIIQYFPEYENYFDAQKRQITIKHLLTMTAGFEWNEDVSYRDLKNSELQMDVSSDPIKYILSRPITSPPGIKWNYNGGESQLLAQIILKASGMAIDKFAEKNLFKPLEINKYEWLTLKENMPAAASGLRLRSRDLLKIGLLYMDNGLWKGKQIVDKEWTNISLSPVVTRVGEKGYGFQFWTYNEVVNGKSIHVAEAKGNGGQRIFFVKELNLLVVITAGNYNKWDIVNDSHKALTDYVIPSIVK